MTQSRAKNKTMQIGLVKVGEWVKYDWQTWRKIKEIKELTRYWIVFRLEGVPHDLSCAPDVEFPWQP